MGKKGRMKLAWLGGAVLATVIFSPPVLSVLNGIILIGNGTSQITSEGDATFVLFTIAFLVFGFTFWLFLNIFGSLSQFLFPFILSWTSALFFFSLLPFLLAWPIWLLFSLLLFVA
jgi:hypothetical protein